MASTRWFSALFSVTLVAAAAMWSLPARAAGAPNTLTEQGRILDSSGNPVTKTVSIVFSIYGTATGGTALWTETQSIQLDDGYFSTGLGATNAINPNTVFNGTVRYLGVQVGSDPEMTPRQVIRSVPYAMNAGRAKTATTATTATTADHVPFSGITNLPNACTGGQFLTGYSANGAPQCATPSGLSNCSWGPTVMANWYHTTTTALTATCSGANEKVISGACDAGGGTPINWSVASSGPVNNQWDCLFNNPSTTGYLYASAQAFCCTVN